MKKVIIVGAGALGSHVVLCARNWEVDLALIDFDRTEAKNVQSQFHTEMGRGKNKARAIQAAMLSLYKVKLDAITSKLERSNHEVLLARADLVIDCTDNFEARNLIQGFCCRCVADMTADPSKPFESIVACLHGCLSADGTVARAVWTEYFKPDAGGNGAATCEDGANLPFHVLAGAMIAQVAQHFLNTGVKQSWQLTPFSLIRLT
jgi:hypothetical protein